MAKIYINKLNSILKKILKIFNIKVIHKKIYLILFLVGLFIFLNKLIFLVRNAPLTDYLSKFNYAIENIHLIFFQGGIISINKNDISISIVIFLIGFLLFYSRTKRNLKIGIEHGSARFGNAKDRIPFIDENFEKNIIFSQTERMTLFKPKDIKYARNKNVLVIGGSGSGKTRFFVKPNLMQMHSSYIVTDPNG